ncbi:MAG: hypothetical protein ACXABI_12110 [Candidatus Hodarchaeales archaeon]|jgi:hypothetical protein
MQDILFGKIVDLKKAADETKEVDWQTKSLKKHIEDAGVRTKGLFMPLDGEDVTEESVDLVKEFLPDIQLSGLELRSERKSKAWGGSYFRVIAEHDNYNYRCIQHVYVWTKQKFFISFWVTILPLFILGIMGTLIYSYLSFESAIVSIILIGSIFFVLGAFQIAKALRGLTRGVYNFSNQHLFVIFGIVMWLLLIEMFITKPSLSIVEGAETWHPEIPTEAFLGEFLEKELRFSYVAAIFIIAGIIALYLWWREPPSFTHATHDMDWAPFFVYIKREGSEWILDKVKYDRFHYYAGTKTKEQLKKIRSLSKDGKRAQFTIPNFWHSFEPKVARVPWLTVAVGLLTFMVAVALAILSFGDFALLKNIDATTIRFVVVPLLLFFGAYLAFSKWPTKIVDPDIDLKDPIYHITDKKLNIFWNLRGEEPAFKVRSKLQDPFMEDEHFASFRDDMEHIMLYSVLPKIRELEQLSQENFFKKL